MTQEINFPIAQIHFPHISTGAEVAVFYHTTQTPEYKMRQTAGPNTAFSCKMVIDVPLQTSTENDTISRLQTSNAESEASNSDNLNSFTRFDHTMLSSHNQSPDFFADKETNLGSKHWEEVPCQTAADHSTFQECQSLHDVALPLKATIQNSLVPYVDIWSLIKPKAPNLYSLKLPKNVIIKKAKCQKLKESNILYPKGKCIPSTLSQYGDEHRIFVHSSRPLTSFKSPILKWPNVEYKSLKNQFHDCYSGWPMRKIKYEGLSFIIPTVTMTEIIFQSRLDSVSLSNRPVVSLLPVDTSKSKCNTQKQKISQPLTLPKAHSITSTDLPEHKLVSSLVVTNLEHAATIKHVAPVQPMVTRSRRKASHVGPSDCLCTIKSSSPLTSPKELTQKIQIVADDHRLAFAVHGHQSRRQSALEIVGSVKCKSVYLVDEKDIPKIKIDKKTQPFLDQHFLREVPKDCLGRITPCPVKRSRRAPCMENCLLKLETQSLNSLAAQEAKRPKICNRDFGQPVISNVQSGIAPVSNAGNVCSLPMPFSKIKEVQMVPNYASMTHGVPLKRQPFRKCKHTSLQQNINLNPEVKVCNLSLASPAYASYNRDHKSLPSRHVTTNIACNSIYAQNRGMVDPYMKRLHIKCLQKCTPEQAMLQQLSAIASRLTAPCKTSVKSKALFSTTKVVPFRGVRLQARKLLKVFSCVNMKISSLPAESVPITSRDHLLSHSMDLFPTDLKICPNDMAHQSALPAFENSTFPVSFHLKVEPSILSEFIKFNPPDYMFKNTLPVTQSSHLPEWTLSIFLSPHFHAADDNVQLFTNWNPNFRCLESSRSDSNYKGTSTRSSGCSMLGLHTVLALSSPGCYRLWTRKRNLGSRIPTVQKLSVMQFAHGLKGFLPQFSQERGTSSLAFSLGRVLSMWSRNGLSAFSFDSVTSHPHCQLWKPGQTFNIRSPGLRNCTTPNLSVDDRRWDSFSIPFLNQSLDLLPKKCFGADELRFQFNSSSRQEVDFSPSRGLPLLSIPINHLSSEKSVDLCHSYTRLTDHGNNFKPVNCLSANPEDSLLHLCTAESADLKPPLPLPTKDRVDFRPRHRFKRLGHAVGPSHFSSCNQNNGVDNQHCVSTEQVYNLGPRVSVLVEQDYNRLDNHLPEGQVDGHGPPCIFPSEPGDCCGPLSVDFPEKTSIGPLHGRSAQHVPISSHSLPTKQGNALGLSQCLSLRQDGHLEPPYYLSHQKTDDPGPQTSLSFQKEHEPPVHHYIQEDNHFGHPLYMFSKKLSNPWILHNLSSQQNGNSGPIQNLLDFPASDAKPPCLLLPSKINVCSLEQKETIPVLHAKAENCDQVNEKQEAERKPQRVSQIKIRKTIPKPDLNLTPMGLPKPKRINKKEFTLEDIYTNKNYKSPPPARSLETIFEEPKEKNGVLVSVSQTKRKRILEFRDCTAPRPKRARGKVRVMASCKRGRKAAMEGVQLDALLIQKLMDLENFLLEQEALEKGSATTENLS